MTQTPGNRGGPDSNRRQAAEVRVGWKMAGISMEVASMVVAGAMLGWGAQAIWGWRHSILTGALVGLAVGLWTLIKSALKLNQQLDALGPRPRKVVSQTQEQQREAETGEQENEDEQSWQDEWDSWNDDDAGGGDQRDE